MFIEASSRGKGQNAILYSPKYRSLSEQCLEFHYHMYGRNVGTLNVYTRVRAASYPEHTPLDHKHSQKWCFIMFIFMIFILSPLSDIIAEWYYHWVILQSASIIVKALDGYEILLQWNKSLENSEGKIPKTLNTKVNNPSNIALFCRYENKWYRLRQIMCLCFLHILKCHFLLAQAFGNEVASVWRAYGNQGNFWIVSRLYIPENLARVGYQVMRFACM